MTLGEAPGGAAFIGNLIDAIKDLSLVYAGTPDDRARQSLETYLDGIETAIIEAVGTKNAPIILDGFRRAALTRKREIEAAGASHA